MSLSDFRRMVDVGATGWLTLEMLDPTRPAPITLCAAGLGDSARLELTIDEARAVFDALARCIAETLAAHAALEAAATRREDG